jgi:hypothetical protein
MDNRGTCGFCRYFGQEVGETICCDCNVFIIRDILEDFMAKIVFDHDHKYRPDDIDHVRNCAHCEHGSTYETRYMAAEQNGEVWCELKGDTSEGFATNKGSDVCEHWVRAVDHRK